MSDDATTATKGSAGSRRHSLLVVDDNAVNRLTLSAWLEKQGSFRVTSAESGMEAIRRIRSESFDLVVLDIMMPVMSGIDVLKRLRQTYSPEELPIVMATARDQTQDMVEAFNLGANDYVTKPINPPVILARIQALLRDRQEGRGSTPLQAFTSLSAVEPGTVLEDKYRLEELIGSGANGSVYSAVHLVLERKVAIKLLHTGLHEDDNTLANFRQEGISACRVDHPNAVTILDFGANRFGIAYLVMELLHGRSLSAEIKQKGRLEPLRTAEILCPVCDALAEAHDRRVIHRDVKPQNIFLHRSRRRGEVVKVLDFGLAKLLQGNAQTDEPTYEGIAGTLAYISPERVSAEPYDGKSDVYSLGVTLYEMLTGRLPFSGMDNPLQMMMMHVRQVPKPPSELVPGLDPDVEEVVMATLEKDPRKRPSAGILKDWLAEVTGYSVQPLHELALNDQTGFMLRRQMEEALAKELADWRAKQGQESGG